MRFRRKHFFRTFLIFHLHNAPTLTLFTLFAFYTLFFINPLDLYFLYLRALCARDHCLLILPIAEISITDNTAALVIYIRIRTSCPPHERNRTERKFERAWERPPTNKKTKREKRISHRADGLILSKKVSLIYKINRCNEKPNKLFVYLFGLKLYLFQIKVNSSDVKDVSFTMLQTFCQSLISL